MNGGLRTGHTEQEGGCRDPQMVEVQPETIEFHFFRQLWLLSPKWVKGQPPEHFEVGNSLLPGAVSPPQNPPISARPSSKTSCPTSKACSDPAGGDVVGTIFAASRLAVCIKNLRNILLRELGKNTTQTKDLCTKMLITESLDREREK